MAVSISRVAFEHHAESLGIGETEPRISWQFQGDAKDWTQSGYDIEITHGDQTTPDVFNFNSSDSVFVPWPTVALESAEAAQVRVRAYGSDGLDTDWSEPFSVETGLLTEEDWQGALMISSDKFVKANQTQQPFLLRKEFTLDDGEEIKSARLYTTAFGVYEAHINGQPVGENVLAPGWQSYNNRLVYDTYDVTDLINQGGENAIGIELAEGWYAGRLGFEGGSWNIWGKELASMSLLALTKADGSKTYVTTDETWESGYGPRLEAQIYNGEQYDARLEEPGWKEPGFSPRNATSWSGVTVLEEETPFSQLTAPDGPPIRPMGEVQLVEVLTTPSGKTVLDFGQDLVGFLHVKVQGPANTTIQFRHAEVMVDGEIATSPLRTATQTDYVTLDGSVLEYRPSFTYHGFRFVEVNGWPTEQTALDNNSVKAIVIHSAMRKTGEFECSNEMLNKLHENVIWSMKGNFMSIPTDCPQRDERLGWTGDAHAFEPTADYLYDTAGFWRGWLRDVYYEQQLGAVGVPPVVIPLIPAAGTYDDNATAVWGDAIVANPWNLYQAFGDKTMLAEHYPAATSWIDSGIQRGPNGMWDPNTLQFGDWLDPASNDPGNATTNSTYVADAYLVYSTNLVSSMAEILGKSSEAEEYRSQAQLYKSKFNDAFIHPNGTVFNETQTGLTLPLYFDLFPTAEESSAAASRLEAIIRENDYLVGTGFAGTHLLGLTLDKVNLTNVMYEMITQESNPSWLYQVVMNATTTWERWNSLLPDGELNPSSMTSFNHYSFGSVANWMHRTIGGLSPREPGWKGVDVRPIPGKGVDFARTSHEGPFGVVGSEWTLGEEGRFELKVTVPPNSWAVVVLPGDGEEEGKRVGSGVHEFVKEGVVVG